MSDAIHWARQEGTTKTWVHQNQEFTNRLIAKNKQGASDHHLPKVREIGPGLYAPIGCNGCGIAVTTALGSVLASFVATGRRTDLPVTVTKPKPKRFSKLLDYGPPLWLGWPNCARFCG